jgi:uncharacterized OB-fold protein/acyl dehydratase
MSDLYERLQALVGTSTGVPVIGKDPVNAPMIRHMVEALGDTNPIYVDDEAARAAGHDGIVAPPTMLMTWSMAGLVGQNRGSTGGWGAALDVLDGAGFTSTVATNCDEEYFRYLVAGDVVSVTGTLQSVSEEKATALGVGHFVTTLDEYRDQDGELVGTHLFRVLKFKPGTGKGPSGKQGEPKALRPRPPTTRDTQWWFDACKGGKLLIQRCTACGVLRHPPGPACAECHSFEWDTVEASGKGTVYSWVVTHHPQVPSFDYPLPVVLVELEEGTRLVSNLLGVDPDDIVIGMPVVSELVAFDDELTIPQFRPQGS